ncbi:MAG TPA: AAC(3) family N-acetyltransferase [Acidimicrobiales bacterium]
MTNIATHSRTTEQDIARAAELLGIGGAALCVHASLRSFPKLEDGPKTLIDGLLSTGATVMVATMSGESFCIPPPPDDRPTRNAIDYAATDEEVAAAPWRGITDIYDPSRVEVDAWLGATSAYVASRPDRFRAPRSGTFSAVGPLAREMVSAENEADVFGPLRALRDSDGWIVLAGAGLTTMTLLHLAEVEAGRRPFIRWMRSPDGIPMRVGVGACSRGFERLAPALSNEERRTSVGSSTWRAYPARAALALATDAMRADPSITRCDDPDCLECPDAIAGGPVDEARTYDRIVSRTDRSCRVIAAPLELVYAALVDPDQLLAWLPPDGMTGHFERFDARPQGSYRLVLRYDDPSAGQGKATPDSDVVEARFVEIVPDTRVVQAVDFVSDGPAFAGTMTIRWDVARVEQGTRVDVTATDVPEGISAEDHAAGLASSLANLAAFLER